MAFFDQLLDHGFRQPASCLITVGEPERGIHAIAQLIASVEISVNRFDAASGALVLEDRRGTDGRWMVADSGMFERWTPIRVQADFGTYAEEVFRGYVTGIKPSYPNNGGEAIVELALQDESVALDRDHQREVWGDPAPMTDNEIVRKLVESAGLDLHFESGPGASSRSLTQDSTAVKFIRERAKASGYEFMISAGSVYFGPPRYESDPQSPLKVYAGRDTNCIAFEVVDDALKPDAVRFDMAPKDTGATPATQTVTPDVPVLGRVPSAGEGSGVGVDFVWRVSKEGDESEEELRARAQALANENSFKLRATGELDGSLYGHVLRVGRTVTADGVGERYGGSYYVDKVVHSFSPDAYRQTFELMRNATGEGSGTTTSRATSAIAALF